MFIVVVGMWRALRPILDRWLVRGAVILILLTYPLLALGVLFDREYTWLPATGDAQQLLGVLLAAQAAVTALTLAVSQFSLQGVANRQNVDSRTYDEYVARSGVRWVFLASILGVAVTGGTLISETVGYSEVAFLSSAPSPRNLLWLTIWSSAQNLAMPLLLFEGSLGRSRPDELRKLRRYVDERDVRRAIRAFLTHEEVDGPVPNSEEAQANATIEALLRDAAIAMTEWRHSDFEWALSSVEALVECAIDELENGDFDWPSSDARASLWPPLARWDMSRLREEVITSGRSWYQGELASLDPRLAALGIRRRSNDLVGTALRGSETSYVIASRVGNAEFRAIFRETHWVYLRDAFPAESREELPYLRGLARHYASLLFRSMHGGHLEDFREFHRGFAGMISNVRARERMHGRRRNARSDEGGGASWVDSAVVDGRVVLMEVGGIGLLIDQPLGLSDSQAYLDVARSDYRGLELLANDVLRSVQLHESDRYFWTDRLDSAPAVHWTESIPVNPAPLFVTLRILELASDPMPPLDFHGQSRLVLNWFNQHAARVQPYLKPENEIGIERRHELVLEALEKAVLADDDASDARF
ncbi:MAG: hypothetical protein F4X26_06950 [Chloroflexi bacterium]|nr:hypothetical protein [Chloroflexota bacterium]